MASLSIQYGGEPLAINAGESLLDAALRQDVAIANSCRNGVCQTCLVKVTAGAVPPAAQKSLSPQQRKQNFALACQLKPELAIEVVPLGAEAQSSAEVVGHELIAENILSLKLKTTLPWEAGQFVSVWKDQNTARPYSIVSREEDGLIECHVQKHSQGKVSRWLHDDVSLGSVVTLSGPSGSCFYDASMSGKNLLIIGSGTGMGALYGIAREALAQRHQGALAVYHGTRMGQAPYLMSEFTALMGSTDQLQASVFNYRPDNPSDEIAKLVKREYPSLQNWCVFLCGSPKIVQSLQRQCFLQGASLTDIHSDPFITRPL